ncbi:Myb DNA-binding like/Myb-like DNA-binding domain containing protein, putative [Angomonas deanei]|uniref:Myb DNA-binding like/Myb-like DNA-binding domain containing protein, putative n=1 Tax=Angomonas deanei TaxID=59799 RepID=A0A7G2C0M2_9TRYP|nr:Myb DNA-binding like/Myb-like DNA-binding domain containing protein, putative [Angomonas deanei]
MDGGEFDFSSELDHSVAPVPPNMWAQLPLDRLPPTRIPSHERASIRQRMRQSQYGFGLRRVVPTTVTVDLRRDTPNPSSAENAPLVHSDAAQEEHTLLGGSTSGSRKRVDWTEEEVDHFYEYLSQFGLDFSAIAVMFPGRTRKEVSKLYSREKKNRPREVERALRERVDINVEQFSELLSERREQEEAHRKELAPEELELLEQIERGDTANYGKDDGIETLPEELTPTMEEVKPAEKKRKRKADTDNPGKTKAAKKRVKEEPPSSAPPTQAVDNDDDLTLLEFAQKIEEEDDMILSDFVKAHYNRKNEKDNEKDFTF